MTPASAGGVRSTCPGPAQALGPSRGPKIQIKKLRELSRPALGWRNEANRSEGVRAWGLWKAEEMEGWGRLGKSAFGRTDPLAQMYHWGENDLC